MTRSFDSTMLLAGASASGDEVSRLVVILVSVVVLLWILLRRSR